ncbi:MAG: hypothetical protein DSY97_02980 [SAR324 cluster bacterium]|uniref:Uncharacterized protein n=1 Tax=SAR324 cluster bacterium TaxID=2024889 RepID=A0A432GB01_9DELT|nr:MAG: hypothetical protein DSY97_02980 [SAR324 cluster bacterium]RTZ88685.1 MAG: hypothetical protein DSY93_07810 [SAR324 cluster bacterium]
MINYIVIHNNLFDDISSINYIVILIMNRKKPNILNYKLIKFYLLKLQQLIIDAKSFSARQTIKLQSSIITTLKEAIFFAYLTIKNASYNIKNILDKFL